MTGGRDGSRGSDRAAQRGPDLRAALARRSGLATWAELIGDGIPDARIRQMLDRGVLVPVTRGAYALAEMVSAAQGDLAREHAIAAAAAARRAGEGAVASHESAAIIHGLSLLAMPDPGLVTLTRSPQGNRSRSGRGTAAVHIAELRPDQVTSVYGAPVTSVARTVIDLARSLPFADGVVVADSALHGRKVSASQLRNVLASCGRWPGVRAARRVTTFSDPRSESALESIARVAFHEGGLPPPDLQVWVGNAEAGFVIGRADFLWPEHGTIGEADGGFKYADPTRAVRQLKRDAALRAAGFEVVHFTWREITSAPKQVVAALRDAFERADAARQRYEKRA
jgi:predicted transcriptional regulator of viral defense system